MRRAVRGNWNTRPLPEMRATIELNRRFSRREMSRIRQGVIPEEMEDKWFVYWEDDTLFFHRSWTGYCVYVVRFSCDENGAVMVSADVNRNPDEYRCTDDDHDAQLIPYLINLLLLRRPAEFPATLPTPGEAALEQWSLVGQAGLGIHPGDAASGRARYVFLPKGAVELSSSEIAARIRGCLLGGAAGDAYGAPLEFLSLDDHPGDGDLKVRLTSRRLLAGGARSLTTRR